MTLREFEQLFKSVCEGYPGITLAYHYDRAWLLNGLPSATFPAVILERQPKVNWEGLKNNHIPQIETFEFKVFFFDTYHHAQRETKEFSEKQTDILEIAKQVFAELTRLDRDGGHNMNFTYQGQFLGDINTNNNELMEVSAMCTAKLKVSCDKLTFTYE